MNASCRGSGPLFLPAIGRRRVESRERHLRIWSYRIEHAARREFADRRTHLETVSRSAAEQPDVRRGGMAIDDEVRIRRRLVLTHFGIKQRCACEARKPPREERSSAVDAVGAD